MFITHMSVIREPVNQFYLLYFLNGACLHNVFADFVFAVVIMLLQCLFVYACVCH